MSAVTVEKKVSYPEVGTLVVTKPLEEKIRTLLALYPSTEWSGIMFYKHTGSLKEKNLVVTAIDLFLMDIGTSGFTTFELGADPSIASYMATHQLFDCHQALIHSHHTMGAFFSGTDTTTLEKEGKTMPNFVSLVVDTAGTYVAAITSRNVYNIKGKYYITTSEFGGDEYIINPDEDYRKSLSKVDIYGLKVVIEKSDTTLFDRVRELSAKSTPSYSYRSAYPGYYDNTYGKEKEEEEKEYKKKSAEKAYHSPYDSLYGYGYDEEDETLFNEPVEENKMEGILFCIFDSFTTAKVDSSFSTYTKDDWNELTASCVEAVSSFEWGDEDIAEMVKDNIKKYYPGEKETIINEVIPELKSVPEMLQPQLRKAGTKFINCIIKALKNG